MAFPPPSLKPILEHITSQLKDRHETVSIAETVRPASRELFQFFQLQLFR